MLRSHALFLTVLLTACDCGGTLPTRMCATEADCNSGEACVDSTCLVTGCTEDDQCAVGEVCIDSVCLEGGASCMSTDECPGEQICVDDRCQAPVCIDTDMDGYGPGCARGADCDPDNPRQTGTEICDGMDNDCDGEADNGVLSECGDCDQDCRRGTVGIGGDDPFEPEEMNSDGVGLGDDGAIELDARRINTNFIWIANTQEGSVSRFSTMPPYNEVGRYFTGPAVNANANFAGNDPSRTSVNSLGDAFVGNRNGNALTRISVLGEECPDSNGDGVITTSQDLNGDGRISTDPADGEMIPWDVMAAQPGDDCVLWHTELDAAFSGENRVRAVAAQDVEGPDGELLSYVWVGGYATNRVAKIDAEDGSVIFSTPAPRNPYGFALDGAGRLWTSTRSGNFLGFLDTTRCVDEASCAADVCTAPSAESDACDGAVKAIIPAPFTLYGVTVDFDQRVWVGGGGIARYDIEAASGSRWGNVALPFGGGIAIHGIAADAVGYVWGAGQGNGVARVDADTLENTVVAGTTGTSNKGMAIDAEGKVWSITQTNEAVVITPGATLDAATVERNVADSIYRPYTYSDMTGLQLRLATNPRGYYRHVFEGCPDATNTTWGEVRFEADTPAGTAVTFRVRTADTRDDLDSAEWYVVGMSPPDSSPMDIASVLMDAGVTPGRFLMLEVILTAERMSSMEVVTPRVLSMDVTHSCPPILG